MQWERDPELAMQANLKTLEGLLKQDPDKTLDESLLFASNYVVQGD